MRVRDKHPKAKGMGDWGSWRIMFEYVDFRYFYFRGINLSNFRHYYVGLRVQFNNDSFFVSFFTRPFNQTDRYERAFLEEP